MRSSAWHHNRKATATQGLFGECRETHDHDSDHTNIPEDVTNELRT